MTISSSISGERYRSGRCFVGSVREPITAWPFPCRKPEAKESPLTVYVAYAHRTVRFATCVCPLFLPLPPSLSRSLSVGPLRSGRILRADSHRAGHNFRPTRSELLMTSLPPPHHSTRNQLASFARARIGSSWTTLCLSLSSLPFFPAQGVTAGTLFEIDAGAPTLRNSSPDEIPSDGVLRYIYTCNCAYITEFFTRLYFQWWIYRVHLYTRSFFVSNPRERVAVAVVGSILSFSYYPPVKYLWIPTNQNHRDRHHGGNLRSPPPSSSPFLYVYITRLRLNHTAEQISLFYSTT